MHLKKHKETLQNQVEKEAFEIDTKPESSEYGKEAFEDNTKSESPREK